MSRGLDAIFDKIDGEEMYTNYVVSEKNLPTIDPPLFARNACHQMQFRQYEERGSPKG